MYGAPARERGGERMTLLFKVTLCCNMLCSAKLCYAVAKPVLQLADLVNAVRNETTMSSANRRSMAESNRNRSCTDWCGGGRPSGWSSGT